MARLRMPLERGTMFSAQREVHRRNLLQAQAMVISNLAKELQKKEESASLEKG